MYAGCGGWELAKVRVGRREEQRAEPRPPHGTRERSALQSKDGWAQKGSCQTTQMLFQS